MTQRDWLVVLSLVIVLVVVAAVMAAGSHRLIHAVDPGL